MTSLRIGTCNVEPAAGADKNAARLDRLLEQDCDVWVLTETQDDLVLDGYAPLSTVQRPGTPRRGARWTTLWSRIGTPRRLETVDPVRTVCAEIDGVVVFDSALVVAGDLNHSLSGEHYYGTRAGRQLLRDGFEAAGLRCLTDRADLLPGLEHPPIDHVAVAAPGGGAVTREDGRGWTGRWDGPGRLSDHEGVAVTASW